MRAHIEGTSDVLIHPLTGDSTVDTVYDLMWLLRKQPINADTGAMVEWFADRQRYKVFVLYFRDEPAGFGVVYETKGFKLRRIPQPEDILLDCLYVEPKYRSLGIGKCFIDWMKQAYSYGFVLRTDSDKAIKFYKREGMRVTQTEKHALDAGIDAYRMLWLPPKKATKK